MSEVIKPSVRVVVKKVNGDCIQGMCRSVDLELLNIEVFHDELLNSDLVPYISLSGERPAVRFQKSDLVIDISSDSVAFLGILNEWDISAVLLKEVRLVTIEGKKDHLGVTMDCS